MPSFAGLWHIVAWILGLLSDTGAFWGCFRRIENKDFVHLSVVNGFEITMRRLEVVMN